MSYRALSDAMIEQVMKGCQVPAYLLQGQGSMFSSRVVAKDQWGEITADRLEQMMLHIDAQMFWLVCECRKCPMSTMRQAAKDSSVLESILQAAAKSGDEADVLIAIDWLDENGYSEAACRLREDPKKALLAIQLAVIDPKMEVIPRIELR